MAPEVQEGETLMPNWLWFVLGALSVPATVAFGLFLLWLIDEYQDRRLHRLLRLSQEHARLPHVALVREVDYAREVLRSAHPGLKDGETCLCARCQALVALDAARKESAIDRNQRKGKCPID
jgi:hypothetical protein